VPQPNLSRRITVSLFSFHPLLPSEFERILPEEGFRVLVRRVDPDERLDPDRLAVPRASVCVVESHRQSDRTEALVASIASKQATARLLVIAEKFNEASAFPLLRLGVKGLMTYSDVEKQLARSLRVIAESGFWVPRTLLSRFVESALKGARRPPAMTTTRRLSRREAEVLELLLQNLSNKEIASQLHISARTAKFHVSNLLAKHGVRRRADLILLAHARMEA
jgi:DNA-binding NarL/FixJ family response regulator